MKIPKGHTCDAHVGWHPDRFGAPVIDRCKALATVTIKTEFGPAWVCAECEPHIREQAARRSKAAPPEVSK